MIIAQKISGHAKRSIRFCHISSYKELYEALRSQVSPISKAGSRTKLQNLRQGITETVQSYTSRFRQILSELEYAIQDEHSNSITRNIILEQENKEAVKFYVHNLRREITHYITPMKPRTLTRAQQEAIEIEIWTKESKPPVRNMPHLTG